MPKRVPNASIVVIRDGKRVTPPLGKAYDFTKAEIESITRVSPGALRKPVNESSDADDEGTRSDDSQAGKESTSQSAPEGSKKATATKGRKATAKADSDERAKTGGQANESSDNDADEDEDEDI